MRANPLLGPTQIARDSDGITIGKLGQGKGVKSAFSSLQPFERVSCRN